jgi:hypothetical protein
MNGTESRLLDRAANLLLALAERCEHGALEAPAAGAACYALALAVRDVREKAYGYACGHLDAAERAVVAGVAQGKGSGT